MIVTTKNEMRRVEYQSPHYDVITKAVGGYYEHVHPKGLKPPYCMMVNESGLLHNLPVNILGSVLYETHIHGNPIVGDIMFAKNGYFQGEPDVVGLTESEAQSLGDNFVELTNGIVRWAED